MDAESKNRIEYTIKGARIQTHTIIATIADVHCTLFNPYRLQITAPESALLVLSHFLGTELSCTMLFPIPFLLVAGGISDVQGL